MAAQSAQSMSAAMMPLGKVVAYNPDPINKMIKAVFNGDEEVKDMFEVVQMPQQPMAPPGGGAPAPAPGLPPDVAGRDQQQTSGAMSAPKSSINSPNAPVGNPNKPA
jgi:hypothetical protein